EEPAMKRLLAISAACAVLAAAVFSRSGPSQPPGAPAGALAVQVEDRNPWNHLRLNNDPSTFRFAIVTDRTGGARGGVSGRPVEQLKWLRPDFVVSVGALLQGGPTGPARINRQWEQFTGFIQRLEMPFFYVPGNHDISNPVMDKRWQ